MVDLYFPATSSHFPGINRVLEKKRNGSICLMGTTLIYFVGVVVLVVTVVEASSGTREVDSVEMTIVVVVVDDSPDNAVVLAAVGALAVAVVVVGGVVGKVLGKVVADGFRFGVVVKLESSDYLLQRVKWQGRFFV